MASNMVNTLVVSLACLLHFAAQLDEELPRRILQHSAFRGYECGKVTRSEALAQVARKYNILESTVDRFLRAICDSCKLQEDLMSALVASGKRLVGWIDIPSQEWGFLQPKFPTLWMHFDELVVGSPKESPMIFIKGQVLIIDRDIERASVLNCQGWSAVAFTPRTREACLQRLRRFGLPKVIQQGKLALERIIHASGARSTVRLDSGDEVFMKEYFAPALICMVTDVFAIPSHEKVLALLRDVTGFITQHKAFGFNGDNFETYPADVDTMSACASVLLELGYVTQEEASNTLDLVLSNTDQEANLLMVYFDSSRPRVDPVAIVNVLFLAYLLHRESHPAVRHQESQVQTFLLNGGYEWGTKYYSPESFLYHYARLLSRFGGERIPNFQEVLQATRDGITHRIGLTPKSSPLEAAKRVLASSMLRMSSNLVDLDSLIGTQNEDGSWPATELYALPNSRARMFNEVVELCFALAALSSGLTSA